jgi:hypothetical protein
MPPELLPLEPDPPLELLPPELLPEPLPELPPDELSPPELPAPPELEPPDPPPLELPLLEAPDELPPPEGELLHATVPAQPKPATSAKDPEAFTTRKTIRKSAPMTTPPSCAVW